MPILSALTVLLLYLMGAVPFAVWAGRTAFASAAGRRADGGSARPGMAATIFLVVLPLVLIAAYGWSSVGSNAPAGDPLAEGPGDWQQIGFLALPPSAGLITGYCIGWQLARRRQGAGGVP